MGRTVMEMKDIFCTPRPRRLERTRGSYALPEKCVILQDSREVDFAAERLQAVCGETCGQKPRRCLRTGRPYSAAFTFQREASLPDDQSYRLAISGRGVELLYGGRAGALYAVSTLKQLLLQFGGALPCLRIEDQPDFRKRGVLYDISRDRMPNLTTLCHFIDFMADVKLNQLFLYVEGPKFAYASYPELWEGRCPLTGEEVLTLDRYCRERCIELVPTQNCLGHMTKWLERDEFRGLAECEAGYPADWAAGGIEKPGTLAPGEAGTRELVANITEDFLPYFSSRHYNVCLDEPYELGMGKSKKRCDSIGKDGVYLEYVLRLRRLAGKHGKSLMLWGDVLQKYPGLAARLPKDVTVLEWGYDPDSPFEKYGREYRETGLDYYVCPGTASWLSLVGRIDKMRGNQRNAAENGLKFGAAGYLVTCWGDRGHWEHYPIAFPGYLYGAALSWGVGQNREADLARGLDLLLFQDAAGVMGETLLRLGELPDPLAGENASVTAGIYQEAAGETESVRKIPDFDFDGLRARAEREIRALSRSRMRGPDAAVWKRELVNDAGLFCHGCSLGKLKQTLRRGEPAAAGELAKRLAPELEALLGEYRQVWLLRNRPDGLEDSTEGMRRLLREYRELAETANSNGVTRSVTDEKA